MRAIGALRSLIEKGNGMNKTAILQNVFVLSALGLLLSLCQVSPAQANSARTYWTGTAGTGAAVTDEDCPVVVEQERLTFDIQEFPQESYQEVSDFLAYSGTVTAEYTFYNPAEYEVNAALAFPFGRIPDYARLSDEGLYDGETGRRRLAPDGALYQVQADGEAVETALRHTLLLSGEEFKLERDLARLQDGFQNDPFYQPEMPVTHYTYMPAGVDTETYPAANAAFVLSADGSKTKVLLEQQNGGRTLDDGVRLELWVEPDEPVVVHVIGAPLERMPDWKFYENGGCENEIGGTMTLVGTETETLQEFALSQYDPESGILEHDWYNAVVESMKVHEWEQGALDGSDLRLDVSRQLMRWYEYPLTIGPGERVVNTVTAPIYPSIDAGYEPPVYEYTYLLSPAQTWADFGTLEIQVNTPYGMLERKLEEFEANSGGYTKRLDGLPEGELSFRLCAERYPKSSGGYGPLALLEVIFLPVLILIMIAGPLGVPLVLLILFGLIVGIVAVYKRISHRSDKE